VPGCSASLCHRSTFSQLRRQLDHRVPLVSWTGASFGAKTGLCRPGNLHDTVIVGSVSARFVTRTKRGQQGAVGPLRAGQRPAGQADLCLVWSRAGRRRRAARAAPQRRVLPIGPESLHDGRGVRSVATMAKADAAARSQRR
jgi:hypothetical protein